jgi:hypothetical protein
MNNISYSKSWLITRTIVSNFFSCFADKTNYMYVFILTAVVFHWSMVNSKKYINISENMHVWKKEKILKRFLISSIVYTVSILYFILVLWINLFTDSFFLENLEQTILFITLETMFLNNPSISYINYCVKLFTLNLNVDICSFRCKLCLKILDKYIIFCSVKINWFRCLVILIKKQQQKTPFFSFYKSHNSLLIFLTRTLNWNALYINILLWFFLITHKSSFEIKDISNWI